MEPRQIPFSPPNISEEEIEEVADTLRSGWITTGPKTKKFEKEIADFLIRNGANVILGNHPAVIQPMKIRKNEEGENVFIAYSLGNYISSIDYVNSKIELVLNIELRKSGEDGKVYLSKVDYTPIYVLDRGQKAENRYQLIDMKGIAKAYANGNKDIVSKEIYEELLKGLDLLEEIVGTKEE